MLLFPEECKKFPIVALGSETNNGVPCLESRRGSRSLGLSVGKSPWMGHVRFLAVRKEAA